MSVDLAASRRLRLTYVLALSAVALLTLVAQQFVQAGLGRAEADGLVINVAGRQRMLSQRIAKAGVARVHAVGDRALGRQLEDQLRRALGDLQAAHRGLVEGDGTAGLPGLEDDDPLHARFAALEPHIARMAGIVDRILEAQPLPSDGADLIAAADQFLPEMHAIVGTLERRSGSRIAALERLETALMLATLLVLLAEALCVFEPAIRKLRVKIREVDVLREQAEAARCTARSFFANCSHEIRTPLTAILGYAEMLRGSELDDDEAREAAQTIRTNGEHLLGLVNDILDLSKIEAGELDLEAARIDTREVVHDVLRICEPLAGRTATVLKFEIEGSVPQFLVTDPLRVRQCLINLVSNAIKFTPGGTVTVRMASRETMLRFDVVDTGPGIPEDRLEAIFGAFEQVSVTTARAHGGTGLGLTISRSLARQMGGDLGVASELGVGSTFSLTLPIGTIRTAWVNSPHEERRRAVATAEPFRLDLSGRCLVVDDGPDIRKLLATMLGKAGLEVETAVDGRDGLDRVVLAARGTQSFDLVLMDIQMPELDGYSAARLIRGEGIDVPLLALTASSLEGERERCLEAGFDGYLPKPIRRATLLNEVQAALEARRAGRPAARETSRSDAATRT